MSNPSFEYWLILHFERTLDTFLTASAAESRLRKHVKKYSKGSLKFSDFSDHVETAIRHAGDLFRERCAEYDDDACECHPCTEVFCLARRIVAS